MELALQILFWLAGSLMLLNAIKSAVGLVALPDLPPDDEPESTRTEPDAPHVNIIIPARNEAPRIECTVRQAVGQTGLRKEVIAINDRSDDDTGSILDRLAGEFGDALTVIHIDTLPDQWLGKCHALWCASDIATGQWLLFLDADAWTAPDTVARAAREVRKHNVEHLAMTPGLKSTSILSRAALTLAFMGLLDRAATVNWRLSKRAFVGVGAFNLIRADFYRDFGGHLPLRMEVIDDLKLGLLVRRAGGHTRIVGAFKDMQVDYGASIPDLLQVVEKNLFAMMHFSRVLTMVAIVVVSIIFTAALTGFLAGSPAGWFASAALMTNALPASVLAKRLGWSPAIGLISPFLFPIFILGIARSAAMTIRQRGVSWRGTKYPLEDLREGLVQ